MKISRIALALALTLASGARAESTLLNTNIDTWIEGTVLSLDADGQKFAVRGVKMPFATVEAQMMSDVAKKTEGLTDPAQKQAKADEVRKSWQSKLDKARTEQVASSPSDWKMSLPDKASLMILRQSQLSKSEKSDPNLMTNISGSSSSASSSASSSGNSSVSVSANAGPGQASAYSSKELVALKSLKDLKVGDKVKVGLDSGLISNTAYVVLEEGTAIR